jgi:hypothetical protein
VGQLVLRRRRRQQKAADAHRVVTVSEASSQQPVEFVVVMICETVCPVPRTGLPEQYLQLQTRHRRVAVRRSAQPDQTRTSSGLKAGSRILPKSVFTSALASRPLVPAAESARLRLVAHHRTTKTALAAKTFVLSSLLDGL